MIGTVILLGLVFYLLLIFYRNAFTKLPNFPPGPPNLPIWGSYWIVLAAAINDLPLACKRIGDWYKTNIIGMFLGGVLAVVVNDGNLIKEMLNKPELDGRMDIILGRLRAYWKRRGIFFTDGYFWHIQRRFSLRYMRDYGFGRRDATLEQIVESDIKELLDIRLNGPKNDAERLSLSDYICNACWELAVYHQQHNCIACGASVMEGEGHTIDLRSDEERRITDVINHRIQPRQEMVKADLVYLPHFLAPPFMNGLLHVIARMNISRENYGTLWELAKGTLIFQRSSNDFGGALSLTPWLKDVLPNYSGYNGLKKGNQHLLDFYTTLVNEVISTHDPSHDRHFLDVYIRQMKKDRKEKERSTYSEEQLVLTCIDYTFPTATAVESVLTMLLERLLVQPELQERLHEEVDRVVGSGRLPNLDDRNKMPFTEACIREEMRFDTLVPLGVPHRSTESTTFAGYDIPKDTMFSANYTMLHMDEAIWGDPENFRPDRFISDGKLDVSRDWSLPFGAGRRLCAGETFARHTMFLVLAALMQRFRVERAPGAAPVPAPRIQGIITTIPEFWVKLTPRI